MAESRVAVPSPRRRLIAMLDTLLHERLSTVWTPSLAIVVVVVASPSARDALPRHVSGSQSVIYATLAGVGATLLGFLIAAVALLAALPWRHPLIERMRTQGLLERAVRQAGRACMAMALVVLVGLVGLVLDLPPGRTSSGRAPALGVESWWIWAQVIALIPATLLLGLTIEIALRAMRLSTIEEPDGPR